MAKEKQKKVLNNMLVNDGVLEPAMKGLYSKNYIHSHKIIKTKSWQELIAKELPDEQLVKVNKEGLEADLVRIAQFEGKITDEKVYADYPTRHRYLETAYKIKGKISDNQQPITQNIQVNFFSNPEIQKATKLYDEAIKEAIINETKKPNTIPEEN